MTKILENKPRLLGLLCLLSVAAYGMMLTGPIVHDDLAYVQTSSVLRLPRGAFLGALIGRDYFAATAEATYQPLVTLFHYFTWTSPPLFRLAGFLLHGVNAFLVLLLARRLGAKPAAAALAGALFVLFPPSTEAVAVSVFKGHLLGAACASGCVLSWLSALEGERRARWLCAGLFALGCLSKETVLLIPALLAAAWALLARSVPWRRALRLGAPILALSAVYAVWRFLLLRPASQPPLTWSDPLAFVGSYVRLLIWPTPLCLQRGAPAGGLLRAAALACLALGWALRKKKALLFCWAWILVELLPYTRLLPFASHNPMADRYLYAPAAGLCVMAALALWGPRARFALYALVLVWGAITLQRNGQYFDTLALAEQTVSCAPENPLSHVMLGTTLMSLGRFSQAEPPLARALDLDPTIAVGWNNLGICKYMGDDLDGAVAAFTKASQLSSDAAPHNNLGNALAAARRYPDAIEEYKRAMAIAPGWSEPMENERAVAALLNKHLRPGADNSRGAADATSARAPRRRAKTAPP